MGIMDKLRGGSPEERFWQWFEKSSEQLLAVETAQERICDELVNQMGKVKQGLTFAFGPTVEGRREFVISADGIKDRFSAVQRLADTAPDLATWKITAFRPPSEGVATLQFGDLRIDSSDIWFSAQPADGKVALTLYMPGLNPENSQTLYGASFIFLDHALGEYGVEMKLGQINWEPKPNDPASQGLRPLTELREAVGEMTA